MTQLVRWSIGAACIASALFLSILGNAQEKMQAISPNNHGYTLSRESVLQGTVVSYTAGSTVAPLGPRVTVQSPSGPIDVHLGNAKLLESNHFTLAPGDSVRIVGETLAFGAGTQFVARVIQKGNQSLTLRSIRGFPLRPFVKAPAKSAHSQAGVL